MTANRVVKFLFSPRADAFCEECDWVAGPGDPRTIKSRSRTHARTKRHVVKVDTHHLSSYEGIGP